MEKLPYWLYDILMYPEYHKNLGIVLVVIGSMMIVFGGIKIWW